jgi:putative sugar O-methyltransferase
MLLDVSNAFVDRPTAQPIGDAAWGRIVRAYQKSKAAEAHIADCYRPSLIWSQIFQNGYMNASTSALLAGDLARCRQLYGNFFRESLSAGLIGFSLEMPQTYMQKNAPATTAALNQYFYFAKNRMERFLKSQPQLQMAQLARPDIGNPYGYEMDGQFIQICAEGHYNYAALIDKLMRGKAAPAVLELGGGYGGAAYYMLRDIKNLRYTGIDLPENIALQTFYLMSAFPEKRFLLYGESASGDDLAGDYAVTLLPGFAIEQFANDQFDCFINSYSLGEMSAATVAKYVTEVCRVTQKYVYHINVNNSGQHTNADTFPMDFHKFELFLRYPDMWSGANAEGHGSEVNEYLYIAKDPAIFR